jgi:hypothetical protein
LLDGKRVRAAGQDGRGHADDDSSDDRHDERRRTHDQHVRRADPDRDDDAPTARHV